ncbi:MAG: 5'-nucleotidase C-terminal domain-containing protein, partial [Gammaproteobacteria bacterium]
MTDIFISYARQDEQRAKHLAKMLQDKGWSVFWDRTIPTGTTWRDYIGSKLDEVQCVITLWSANSVKSEWVIEEADIARQQGNLIPVVLDGVSPPLGFGQVQAAFLTDADLDLKSPKFIELLGDIERLIKARSSVDEDVMTEPETEPELIEQNRIKRVAPLAIVTFLIMALGLIWIYREGGIDLLRKDIQPTLPQEPDVSIIYLNDWKGFFEGDTPVPSWQQACLQHNRHWIKDPAMNPSIGGAARIATKIREINQSYLTKDSEPPLRILVVAGNALGTHRPTIQIDSNGEEIAAEYRALAFFESLKTDLKLVDHVIVVLGENEFDLGLKALDGVLSKHKNIEFLTSLNIHARSDGHPSMLEQLETYHEIDFQGDGARIGIIGITNSRTREQLHHSKLTWSGNKPGSEEDEDIEFPELADIWKQITGRIKERPELLIAVTTHGTQDDIKLAELVGKEEVLGGRPNPIDAIIGSGNDWVFDTPVSAWGTRITQAGSLGRYLGQMDFSRDPITGRLELLQTNMHPVIAKLAPDPSIRQLFPEAVSVTESTKPQLDRHLCGERSIVRFQSAGLPNVVTDLMRQAVPDADIAFINAGAIGGSLNKGVLRSGDLERALPYTQHLYRGKLSGKVILDALNLSASYQTAAVGAIGLLHPSALTYRIVDEEATDIRVRRDAGDGHSWEYVPLDKDQEYTVVTIDYVKDGGDGYTMFTEGREMWEPVIKDGEQLNNRKLFTAWLETPANERPLFDAWQERIITAWNQEKALWEAYPDHRINPSVTHSDNQDPYVVRWAVVFSEIRDDRALDTLTQYKLRYEQLARYLEWAYASRRLNDGEHRLEQSGMSDIPATIDIEFVFVRDLLSNEAPKVLSSARHKRHIDANRGYVFIDDLVEMIQNHGVDIAGEIDPVDFIDRFRTISKPLTRLQYNGMPVYESFIIRGGAESEPGSLRKINGDTLLVSNSNSTAGYIYPRHHLIQRGLEFKLESVSGIDMLETLCSESTNFKLAAIPGFQLRSGRALARIALMDVRSKRERRKWNCILDTQVL